MEYLKVKGVKMSKVIDTLDFFQKSLFDKFGLDLEAAKKQPATAISFLTQGTIPSYQGTSEGERSPITKATWSGKLKKWLPHDAYVSLFSASTKLYSKKLEKKDIDAVLSILNNLQGNLETKKAIESSEFKKIYDTYEEYFKKSQESPKSIKDEDKDIDEKVNYNKKLEEYKNNLHQKQMAISHFWKDFETKHSSIISNRVRTLEALSKIMDDSFISRLKNVFLSVPEATAVKTHVKDSLEKFQEETSAPEKKDEAIEIDKDKKDFNKKDLEFIIKTIKEFHGPAGAHWREVHKHLSKYFNSDLMSNLEYISKKHAFPKGMVHFLENYDEMKSKLKDDPLTLAPSTDLLEGKFKKSIGDVLDNLDELKKANPVDYKNSTYEYIENFVKFFKEYLKNTKRNAATEQLMGMLVREITSLASSLKTNPFSKNMRELKKHILSELKDEPLDIKLEGEGELTPEKLIHLVEKQHKSIPMVTEIKKFLSDMPKEISEKDKDIKTLFKEHKEKKIEDIVKSSSILTNYKSTPYATFDEVIEASNDLAIKNELENIRFLLYAYV